MIKHLALLWALLTGRLDDVDDVDLVPATCDDCGDPLGYCGCVTAEPIPHDLSDYDAYVEATR